MSMEATFVVTWVSAILIGLALGVVTYFVFEHDTKKKKEDEDDE